MVSYEINLIRDAALNTEFYFNVNNIILLILNYQFKILSASLIITPARFGSYEETEYHFTICYSHIHTDGDVLVFIETRTESIIDSSQSFDGVIINHSTKEAADPHLGCATRQNE